MIRHVSAITLQLLEGAGLTADALDREFDGRAPAVLRKAHPMLVAMSNAAGLNVVQAARRSRYLLIEIEQHESGATQWVYREKTARDCIFSCRGTLPDALQGALEGRMLGQLVDPHDAISATTIEHAVDIGAGWLAIGVSPRWETF